MCKFLVPATRLSRDCRIQCGYRQRLAGMPALLGR
jgi:hypothetical protein